MQKVEKIWKKLWKKFWKKFWKTLEKIFENILEKFLENFLEKYIYIYIYVCVCVCVCVCVYYYTPLPLNLANKQQASNNKQATTSNKQQALLLTVLAIAPPHRSGFYSTLTILEPRWFFCQIQVHSQKLSGGGPGRGRQVGRCPPKSAQFWAKKTHFSPKTAPKTGQNAQTKGYGEYTARAA